MNLLIAPLHYFANRIDGSEYTRSFEYLEYLSKSANYSGDVLMAYSDFNKIGGFKIHSFLKIKPTFISIPLRMFFIPWIFYKSWNLTLKNKYDCIWHQGPFAINETFSLVSILQRLLRRRQKMVIGPILTPHSVRKISGMGIIKMGKDGELVRHSIWNEIDLFFYKKFSKTFSYLSFLTLKKAHKVLTIDSTGKSMIKKLGIHNVQVLTLTLPDKNFLSKPKSNPNKIVRLLNVSYLVGRKRTDDLVEAVNILVNKWNIKNIKLKIVGDGPEKLNITYMIKKLGLEDYVEMIGLVPRTKVHIFYKEADIFLSGSISDIMPGMYFEAMSASLPMVISENVTSLEFKRINFGGIVVKGESPQLVAKAIFKIMNNKGLYYKYSRRNYKLINSKYNFEKGMEKLKYVFEN